MTENKTIAVLNVLDVIEKPDGSADLILDVSDDFKNKLKSALGWKRWSNKKFEKYVIQALTDYVKGIEDGTIIR